MKDAYSVLIVWGTVRFILLCIVGMLLLSDAIAKAEEANGAVRLLMAPKDKIARDFGQGVQQASHVNMDEPAHKDVAQRRARNEAARKARRTTNRRKK